MCGHVLAVVLVCFANKFTKANEVEIHFRESDGALAFVPRCRRPTLPFLRLSIVLSSHGSLMR